MQRIHNFALKIKKYITELNLFKDGISDTDPSALRTAILSTRVYIVLLAVFLIALVIFNAIGTQPEVVLILNPSQSDYEDFIDKYRNLSSCPCSRVTIPYASFTSTTVTYHPICQSLFVSDDWINELFSPQFLNMYQLDFRVLGNNYFQLLATFCSHVKQSVNDTLSNFHLQTFFSPNVLLEKSLDAEINGMSQYLQSSIMNNVHQLLLLVRTTTRSNKLQAAVPLSTRMYMATEKGIDILQMKTLLFRYTYKESCSCSLMNRCSMPSGFFNSSQRSASEIQSAMYIAPIANVAGFFVGCLPVESLLISTLECLFDSSCLNIIHRFIPSSNMTGVHALNKSQTRFLSETPIEYLIDELFLEEWSIKANFSNYYVQCAPILCTHTLFKRKDFLYIINELLSLYGGLTAVLCFFVPRVIGLLRKRRTIVAQGPRPGEYYLIFRVLVPTRKNKERIL